MKPTPQLALMGSPNIRKDIISMDYILQIILLLESMIKNARLQGSTPGQKKQIS
jgi:hypothetical protein